MDQANPLPLPRVAGPKANLRLYNLAEPMPSKWRFLVSPLVQLFEYKRAKRIAGTHHPSSLHEAGDQGRDSLESRTNRRVYLILSR